MALREGHGRGAGTPRVEVLPPDEQPHAPAGVAAPILAAGRDASGRLRTSEAARALAKLPRRGTVLPRKIACLPGFDVHNRRRLDWLKARRQELADATGAVSHGVGAMLAHAAWMYAASEFAAERAAETGDMDLFKQSAALSATARQHDLAAWEMAVREGKARHEAGSAPHATLLAALASGGSQP